MDTPLNKTSSNNEEYISILNNKDLKQNTNESSAKVNLGIDNGDVLVKVSSEVEQQEDITNLTDTEIVYESNTSFEELANQFEESTIQKAIGQDRVINSSDTTLIASKKVILEQDIARESQLNSLNKSSIQKDTLAPSKEVDVAQVHTEFESTTEIKDKPITDVTQSIVIPAETDQRNQNAKRENKVYTSQVKEFWKRK